MNLVTRVTGNVEGDVLRGPREASGMISKLQTRVIHGLP